MSGLGSVFGEESAPIQWPQDTPSEKTAEDYRLIICKGKQSIPLVVEVGNV